MTPEEIKALQDEKAEAERIAEEAKKAAEQAKLEAEKARTDLTGVVDELKEERQKKAEALAKANINKQDEPEDISTAIERALKEKEDARRKAELEQAINEFRSSKTEFSSDETGLVFEKFKQGLKSFNLEGISSKEEAKDILEKAYKFNKLSEESVLEGGGDYAGTPAGAPAAPALDNKNEERNEKLSEATKIPVDKLKQLQDKFPDAFEGLGV
jgi:hypothetical protein